VPFLPWGCYCPLQTILLSDQVGCDSPLQKEMAVWRPLKKKKFKGWKRPLLSAEPVIPSWMGTTALWEQPNKKKGAKQPLLSTEGCHTQVDGHRCPLRTYLGIFLRVWRPSEDINSHLFLMNKKRLKEYF